MNFSQFRNFLSNASSFFQTKTGEYVLLLIFFLLLGIALSIQGYVHFGDIRLGDQPSYLNFDFSSLEAIFQAHRMIVIPILAKITYFVFGHYDFWPHLNFAFYFVSLTFFYYCLRRVGVRQYFAFPFVVFLAINTFLLFWARHILSEVVAICFVLLMVGNLLLAMKERKAIQFFGVFVFSVLVFMTRPAFVTVIILTPLWALFTQLIFKNSFKETFKNAVVIGLLVYTPFALYSSARWLKVGHFGAISYDGISLSGHSVYLLTSENVDRLEGRARQLGEMILFQKKRLDPPCNELPSDRPNENDLHFACVNNFGMTAWLEAIALLHEDRLFELEDPRSAASWKHVKSLSGYYASFGVVEVNQIIKDFSVQMLGMYPEMFRDWVWGMLWYSAVQLKNILPKSMLFWPFVISFLLVWSLVFWGSFIAQLGRHDLEKKNQVFRDLKDYYKIWIFFFLSGLSLYVLGAVISSVFSNPHYRYLGVLSYFLAACFYVLLVPPLPVLKAKKEIRIG